jgi:hypothetical protein
MIRLTLCLTLFVAWAGGVFSASAVESTGLKVSVGSSARITNNAGSFRYESSAPEVAEIFQNGFVVGLKPGQARIMAHAQGGDVAYTVTVESPSQALVDPATLTQFPDSRGFTAHGRKCFGSELNGQRAIEADERKFTRSNRVINPKPLRPDKPLDWELVPGAKVFDGAGVEMGEVPATLKAGDRTVPASMFNFGASKVIRGRICVYAFSVSIIPSATVRALMEPGGSDGGRVTTSAWLALDSVVDKEALLERIGLGRARLPALPLAAAGFRVTGGDPKLYMTPQGELHIVRRASDATAPPVPSHYLRRPSGTVNLIYSVPGFGLGGQGTDSFLVSDGLQFFPAVGAKVFEQPTYYPAKDPRAGQPSPKTMTFLYGAVKTTDGEPGYGWMAKEALAPN